MKYWFDTEFIEDGKSIDLISIGIVAEDGREYYAENYDCRYDLACEWVRANVLAHLKRGETVKPYLKIRGEVQDFIGKDSPEIWAYYADYDWVALCQLFGTMMDLPKEWPMYCRDVKQLADFVGNPNLPEQTSVTHNALEDALWVRSAYEFLMEGNL